MPEFRRVTHAALLTFGVVVAATVGTTPAADGVIRFDDTRPYDLSRDPAETTDVSNEHPERYQQMLRSLNRWSEEVESDRTTQKRL